MSNYGVFSGLYFPVFWLNTGKYGPEKTPYLDTLHAVFIQICSHYTDWKSLVLMQCMMMTKKPSRKAIEKISEKSLQNVQVSVNC